MTIVGARGTPEEIACHSSEETVIRRLPATVTRVVHVEPAARRRAKFQIPSSGFRSQAREGVHLLDMKLETLPPVRFAKSVRGQVRFSRRRRMPESTESRSEHFQRRFDIDQVPRRDVDGFRTLRGPHNLPNRFGPHLRRRVAPGPARLPRPATTSRIRGTGDPT